MYLGIVGLVFLLGGIALMNYNYSVVGFSVSALGIFLINKKYRK